MAATPLSNAQRDTLLLSHANPEDNEFTLWLALQLAKEGYRVWCDLTKLLGGEVFWDNIEEVIKIRAAKVIYVLSQISNAKDGPLKELLFAQGVAKKEKLRDFVIPLQIDDLPHGDITIEITRVNTVPFVKCFERWVEWVQRPVFNATPLLGRPPFPGFETVFRTGWNADNFEICGCSWRDTDSRSDQGRASAAFWPLHLKTRMPQYNDNRMGWIRNLEALADGSQQYTVEYEVGSECHIPGLLDYADGKIICASMSTEESKDGLWLYNLAVRYPLGPHNYNLKADKKGYSFKDGILGELLALMSLFFRCRFFLISTRLPPGNPSLGMTIKKEYPFVRVRCNPGIHPPLFQSSNSNLATEFKDFLDVVQKLDRALHQDFILACHHYARAIKEVGVDSEMVFIRLVSAIEALSKNLALNRKDDALDEQRITDLIVQSSFSTEHKKDLQEIFDVRKSKKRRRGLSASSNNNPADSSRAVISKPSSQAPKDKAIQPWRGSE